MSCPNDTDHDGDCHLCHRLPGGCFLRSVFRPALHRMIAIDVQRDRICTSEGQTFTTPLGAVIFGGQMEALPNLAAGARRYFTTSD